MKTSEFMSGENMRGTDFAEGEQRGYEICNITAEKMGRGRDAETKLVMSFKDEDKGLVLNKTNMSRLVESLGNETDNWIGHSVTIKAVMVEFQGERMLGLRIVDVDDSQAKAKPAKGKPVKAPF